MYVCLYIVCVDVCIEVRIYEYMYIFQCMYDMTCGICFSSSDCDGFAMSLMMERVVKVSDWSLQAILPIDSMALLLTIGSPTYIHTRMRSENRRP